MSKYDQGLAPYSETEAYDSARIVQIAWSIYRGRVVTTHDYVVRPGGVADAVKGPQLISTVFDALEDSLGDGAFVVVAHDVQLVSRILLSELFRQGRTALIQRIGAMDPFCITEQSRRLSGSVPSNVEPDSMFDLRVNVANTLVSGDPTPEEVYQQLFQTKRPPRPTVVRCALKRLVRCFRHLAQ